MFPCRFDDRYRCLDPVHHRAGAGAHGAGAGLQGRGVAGHQAVQDRGWDQGHSDSRLPQLPGPVRGQVHRYTYSYTGFYI